MGWLKYCPIVMKTSIFITFIFMFNPYDSYSQSLQFEYGAMNHFTYIEQSTTYSEESTHENDYLALYYSHKLKEKINMILGYTQYRPYTEFNIESNPNTNLISKAKASGICNNYVVGINYYMIDKRVKIISELLLHGSVIKKSLSSISGLSNKPYQGTIQTKVYEGFQILPDFRLNIEAKIYKGIRFYINSGYMIGFKKVQDLIIKHSLNGVKQPDGLNYINGTNWHIGIGLKYDWSKK